MSYSYELQARVYDRMVELEAAIQKPALPNFMGKVPKVLEAGSSAQFLAHVPGKVGKGAVRDAYFMVKVPKVLGDGSSPKFLGHVPVLGPKGAIRQPPRCSAWRCQQNFLLTSKCPARTAVSANRQSTGCPSEKPAAMSYSYELQARQLHGEDAQSAGHPSS